MHLTLHLTNRCNLACSYCYSQHGNVDMSFNTAIKSISNCAQDQNCGIIFFGGEPLLCKEMIWEVINWCDEKYSSGFHYKVTTNGILLDKQFMEKAVHFGLHVALSHDGVKKTHDRWRRNSDGKGTFDELISKLDLLFEYQPYSPVMLTVNPETVNTYAESVKWLADKGAQYLICSLNHAALWNDSSLKKLRKEYLKLEKWHFDNYQKERKIYFSPFDKRIASHIFPERGNSCRLGKRQISVGPKGILYPCVQFVGHKDYAIGTAEKGIDKKRQEKFYNMNEENKPECTDCDLINRCHNKCGCLNFQTMGDIRKIPPLLCEHERMVFPIADRLAEHLFKISSPMFIQRHYNTAFPILSFLEDLSN